MSMYLNLTTFLVVWNTNAFQLFNVLIYYLDLVIARLIKNKILILGEPTLPGSETKFDVVQTHKCSHP